MKKIVSLGLLLLQINFICYGPQENTTFDHKVYTTTKSESNALKQVKEISSQSSQPDQSHMQKLTDKLSQELPHEQKFDAWSADTDPNNEDSIQIVETSSNTKKLPTTTDDLTNAQFLDAANLLEKMRDSKALVSKSEQDKLLLGKTMDAWLPDVNATNKRIKNLETANRTTAKSILSQIKSAELKQERTGKYNITSFASRRAPEEDILAYKNAIAENLIQSTLDNVFGKDSMSGQSLAKFTRTDNNIIMTHILNETKYKDLFDWSKSDIERLNTIADISDEIMNRICASEAGSSQRSIGRFETKIHDDGTYEQTITNDLGAITTTKIDNKGKVILQEYTDTSNNATFRTEPNDQGKMTTKYIDAQGNEHPLTSYEESLTSIAYAQHKAMIIAKSILKASLWTGKQAIINLITYPIPMTLSIVAVAGFVPLVKGGSMIAHAVTGNEAYAWSSPTVRSAIMHIIELSCGDRRGILSGQQGRVFRQGTMLSKAANAINPFGKDLSTTPETPEEKNQHEEYYTLINTMIDAVMTPVKALFPETLGDTLVSKASLDTERAKREALSNELNQDLQDGSLILRTS